MYGSSVVSCLVANLITDPELADDLDRRLSEDGWLLIGYLLLWVKLLLLDFRDTAPVFPVILLRRLFGAVRHWVYQLADDSRFLRCIELLMLPTSDMDWLL